MCMCMVDIYVLFVHFAIDFVHLKNCFLIRIVHFKIYSQFILFILLFILIGVQVRFFGSFGLFFGVSIWYLIKLIQKTLHIYTLTNAFGCMSACFRFRFFGIVIQIYRTQRKRYEYEECVFMFVMFILLIKTFFPRLERSFFFVSYYFCLVLSTSF